MKKFLFVLIFIFSLEANSEEEKKPEESKKENFLENPSKIIGMNLNDAFKEFGVPDEVFSIRGDTKSFDDVVFFYENYYLYLFWYRNKVFQVSFDFRYKNEILGFKMGESIASAKKKIKKKLAFESEKELVFDLDFESFLKRVKIIFEKNKMTEIYIYRGDY